MLTEDDLVTIGRTEKAFLVSLEEMINNIDPFRRRALAGVIGDLAKELAMGELPPISGHACVCLLQAVADTLANSPVEKWAALDS